MNKLPQARLQVDVVCDTQQELEELLHQHGFGDVRVVEWQLDGPGGGCSMATLQGDIDAVYTAALELGYEEEIVLSDLEPVDGGEWTMGPGGWVRLSE